MGSSGSLHPPGWRGSAKSGCSNRRAGVRRVPVLSFLATSSNNISSYLRPAASAASGLDAEVIVDGRAIVASPIFKQGESALQLTSAVYLLVEPAPTDVSPIIKAVTDPFSLLALIVLVLGLIATKWVPRRQDGKARLHLVALSILVVSLLII